VLPQAGFLGVLMLDTRFDRLPGDIGHPASFGVPVRQRVVQGAYPREVVGSAAALRRSGLGARFAEAARALEAEGARALTTSCGFLVLLQDELQRAVRVPLVSSSLLRLPALLRERPQVGVLTISAEALGPEFLLAAGVPEARLADVVIEGLPPEGAFAGPILGNRPGMEVERAAEEVAQAARALRARAPVLRDVVLECTNLPPHAHAVRAAGGWQVHSLLDEPRLTAWAATSSTAAR
jgi:hypothetical protein